MNALEKHIRDINNMILSDKIDRAVLSTVHAQVTERIFHQGRDDANSQIGTYSAGYMKTRRKKGWPNSSKVILQATRQMVNDFSLIRIRKNHYGSGFKNNINGVKRQKMEDKYKKQIFSLTDNEENSIGKLYNEAVKRYLR